MQAIRASLQDVVARTLKRTPDSPLLAWPLACGSAVAERTQALSFRAGVLWIGVPDVDWRAELLHLVPRYLAAVNKYSAVPVERIEFVIEKQERSR